MKKVNAHVNILHKCRQMILLMNIHLNHFPRHEKYGLCQQIREAAYDVYGLMIEGHRKYQNKTTLTRLDIRHEQLRMFINLAFEMGYYRNARKAPAFRPGMNSADTAGVHVVR